MHIKDAIDLLMNNALTKEEVFNLLENLEEEPSILQQILYSFR